MRFIMMIKSDAQAEAGLMPDQKILTDMGKFNDEIAGAGVMLGGEGLKESSHGARVRSVRGKLSVHDGPFAESKELIAGFWMIRTASKAEAVEWARRVPGAEIELSPVFELDDFPVDPTESDEGWRAQEQRFREESGAADGATAASAPVARKPGTKRFMLLLKKDAGTESGALPRPEILAKMGALMDELARSGGMLAGEGLKPSSEGVRVSGLGAARRVIDGPFTESKEVIAGYLIIQVASKAEAIDLAKRWLVIHMEGVPAGVTEGEIEVREVMELEDIPVDAGETPDGWRQKEIARRDRLAK